MAQDNGVALRARAAGLRPQPATQSSQSSIANAFEISSYCGDQQAPHVGSGKEAYHEEGLYLNGFGQRDYCKLNELDRRPGLRRRPLAARRLASAGHSARATGSTDAKNPSPATKAPRWAGDMAPSHKTAHRRFSAQAIEARRAETGAGSVGDESAVAESHAPNPISDTPNA